jgi:hypothetical protein
MDTLILATNLPAEWIDGGYASLLFAGLILAGIGTISLFGIGLFAYRRRPTTRYLLITLALGALVVRTVVGWGTALGYVPMTILMIKITFGSQGIVRTTSLRS